MGLDGGSQRCRRCGPSRGDPLLFGGDSRLRLFGLGVERPGQGVVLLQRGEARSGPVTPGHHLGEGVAVLAAQIVEQLATISNPGLALGVVLDALPGRSHLRGHIGHLGGEGA